MLANLGSLEHQAGRLAEARRHLTGAIRRCRRMGMRRFEAFALSGLAYIDHEEGQLVDAAERGERALDPAVHQAPALPAQRVLRQARAAARFEKTPTNLDRPAPTLGEHTDEILAELGLER